jgi:hypothetical protein
MPNTLVHIGVNGLTSRAIIKSADLKWIYIGCIIPDIPWILQRILKEIPGVNHYDLRLYSIIQASLLFCLVLSAALSLFSKRYLNTFLILVLGSLFHLLLDAVEIKWANGVHLFAPFNWSLLNFGLVWPENILIGLLTLLGLIYFFWNWKNAVASPTELVFRNPKRNMFFVLFMLMYFALPLTFMEGPRNADNHFVKTLSNKNDRTGNYMELDRRFFNFKNKTINIFADEDLKVEGINLNHSAMISVKAKFINNNTIQMREFHEHNADIRDGASYLALLLIAMVWIISVFKYKFNKKTGGSEG